MTRRYEIRPGDCISSIAFEHGFAVDTIWNDPANAELKNARGDGYTLVPGDVVFIPDRVPKSVPCTTGRRHRFRRRNVPEMLRLEFYDEQEKPRAGLAYVLEIDGRRKEGETDAEGKVVQAIAPNARRGTISFPKTGERYVLQLGHLTPATDRAGAVARLIHLGYLPRGAEPDDDALTAAVTAFQRVLQLDESGVVDDATAAKLTAVHGS